MTFWINFWTVFFAASLIVFAGVAIVVTIGGFFNIRSLFKSLTDRPSGPPVGASKHDDAGRS